MTISRPAGTYRDDYGIDREWDGTAWIFGEQETWHKYPGGFTGPDGIKLGWDGAQWINLDQLAKVYQAAAPKTPNVSAAAALSKATSASPRLAPKPKGLGCGMWSLIIFVVVAIIVVASSAAQNANPDVADQGHALVACQDFVQSKLKAPSTAKFQAASTVKVSAGVWAVTGTVDAQNGFGALIRNSYKCTVTVTKDATQTKLDYLQ